MKCLMILALTATLVSDTMVVMTQYISSSFGILTENKIEGSEWKRVENKVMEKWSRWRRKHWNKAHESLCNFLSSPLQTLLYCKKSLSPAKKASGVPTNITTTSQFSCIEWTGQSHTSPINSSATCIDFIFRMCSHCLLSLTIHWERKRVGKKSSVCSTKKPAIPDPRKCRHLHIVDFYVRSQIFSIDLVHN